jgi:hypothetical protein
MSTIYLAVTYGRRIRSAREEREKWEAYLTGGLQFEKPPNLRY